MSDDLASEAWGNTATQGLLALQNSDGGWGYQAGQASATEPTALAVLALYARNAGAESRDTATEWLGSRRRADGLFSASAIHTEPSWLTPLAGLAMDRQGLATAAQAAADGLLGMPVYTFTPPLPGVYNYDTLIAGWPWTTGDFSLTEPTCLAMIFLKRLGCGNDTRVRDGARMLRDRALAAGGWNYGEPRVLGGVLFTTVLPTALALLALADEQDDTTAAALTWLGNQAGQISSLLSLGWATIALNVLGQCGDDWANSVASRWLELPAIRRGPMETSLCLLGLASRDDHPFKVTP